MADEPRWVAIDELIAFNRQIVEASGEPHCLRDRQSLHKAVAHPWNVYIYFMDRDIAVLAARLFTGVAHAGAFAAGNKRTALRAATAFVEANGFELALGDNRGRAVELLFECFDGRLSQAGIVEWFRLWMTPR